MATGNQVLPGAPETAEPMTTEPDYDELGEVFRPRRPSRGAGGRWLVWLMRAVVWLVVLLIGYRGVVAIVTSYAGSGAAAPRQVATHAAPAARHFPVTLAQAYALAFGQAYLSYSPATAGRRAAELAQFLPPGSDPQLGWNGVGTSTLQSEQVAGIRVTGPHTAIVTLLAMVDGNLLDLGVPIYASGGAMVVSGEPARLAAPAHLTLPPAPRVVQDPSLTQAMSQLLPGFLRAFARSDTPALKTYTAPGTRLSGLGKTVSYGGILQLSAPAAGGATRQVTVTVEWVPASAAQNRPPPASAQVDMTYAIGVVRLGGRWYVKSVGAAGVSQGAG